MTKIPNALKEAVAEELFREMGITAEELRAALPLLREAVADYKLKKARELIAAHEAKGEIK